MKINNRLNRKKYVINYLIINLNVLHTIAIFYSLFLTIYRLTIFFWCIAYFLISLFSGNSAIFQRKKSLKSGTNHGKKKKVRWFFKKWHFWVAISSDSDSDIQNFQRFLHWMGLIYRPLFFLFSNQTNQK